MWRRLVFELIILLIPGLQAHATKPILKLLHDNDKNQDLKKIVHFFQAINWFLIQAHFNQSSNEHSVKICPVFTKKKKDHQAPRICQNEYGSSSTLYVTQRLVRKTNQYFPGNVIATLKDMWPIAKQDFQGGVDLERVGT